MNITLTGSLGNIGQPLTKELVQKGHRVTVISSRPETQKDIEALGAHAAIGSIEDVAFLSKAFNGADLVYCMIPPNYHQDASLNLIDYWWSMAENYGAAIRQSGVKQVIHLSSIGAHMDKDSGLILGHHNMENILRAIPGIAITHLRPTAFYYNLLAFIPVIKHTGHISSNYGAGDRIPWVSPRDIAMAVAEEMELPMKGIKVRYVASDEPTCQEIATALGAAIGKPDMQWNVISDEALYQRFMTVGLSESLAKGLTEMNASMHNGKLMEDYFKNRPVLGTVKLAEYAKEFAAIYATR